MLALMLALLQFLPRIRRDQYAAVSRLRALPGRNATVALVSSDPIIGFLRGSVDPLIKRLQPGMQLVDSLAAGVKNQLDCCHTSHLPG